MTKRTWFAVILGFVLIAVGTSYFLFWQEDDSSTSSSESSQTVPNEDDQTESSGESVTLKGEMVCLPHKNTEGPQTLECAYGLLDESGTYFALQDTSMDYSNITKVAMGDIVRVTGVKISQPSSNYQSNELIKVQSIDKAE